MKEYLEKEMLLEMADKAPLTTADIEKIGTDNTSVFKELFRQTCRKRINDGLCDDDQCEFCAINTAWEMIF